MDTYDQNFEEIREYLLNQFAAGQMDTEEALAKRFKISRYRVRKVLTALSQMGVLDRSQKKGSKLREPNTEIMSEQIRFQFKVAGFDVAEFIEARSIIECAIMPVVVRRITPSLMTQLENALCKIEENADNPLEADKHDRDFHLLMLKACGNRVLEVFSSVLITYFEKTTNFVSDFGPEYFHEIVREERAILDAIRANDHDLAADLLQNHLSKEVLNFHRKSGINKL